jgi:hypothetical protein
MMERRMRESYNDFPLFHKCFEPDGFGFRVLNPVSVYWRVKPKYILTRKPHSYVLSMKYIVAYILLVEFSSAYC